MRSSNLRFPILAGLVFLVLAGLLAGCREEPALVEDEVLKTVLQGEAWWNEGSLEAYMDTYWNSPELRFVSGDSVTYGWRQTLDRYLARYTDKEAMGRLVYSDLDVTVLSNDAALVFGSWELVRDDGRPHGHFTLVLRKFDEGWRVIHDQTSSAD